MTAAVVAAVVVVDMMMMLRWTEKGYLPVLYKYKYEREQKRQRKDRTIDDAFSIF